MTNEKQKGTGKRVIQLRPEARPAPYSQLESPQREAFNYIVEFISEAIGDIDTAVSDSKDRMPSWVESWAASRTAFLYGDRGTGKTTVLLSLIHASSVSDDPKYPEDLREAMRAMRERVVWLEPIGIDRLPASANLLAAFLARIDQAVRQQIQVCGEGLDAAGDCSDRGALRRVPYYEKALLRLQHLQTAVAVAWDGNLPARGGQLDPDSYAVEVTNAERKRLSLQSDLSQALHDLACYLYRFSASVRNPIFVLPVDDVDLDPLRCLDVLKLLRLIQVPRLFTLVLGNVDLVETVLNLTCSSELASAYKPKSLAMLSVTPAEVARRAGEVAANAMRKLIPPAQRIILKRFSARESLNYVPLVADSEGLSRLHELLAECPLELPVLAPRRAPKNLREFLLCTEESKKTKESKKEVKQEDVERSHYSAINILNAPPRRVADWWLELQRLLDLFDSINNNKTAAVSKQLKTTEIHREIVFAMGRICYSAISEDPMLTTQERSTYRQALRINPAGIWELGKVVDAIPDIDSSYTLSRLLFPEAPNDPRAGLHPASRILINHGKGWIWRPGEGGMFIPPAILDPAIEPDGSRSTTER